MSQISKIFANKKNILISFITAGYPNPELSKDLLLAASYKTDILEIGIPFSDPAGDGPIIEDANNIAIKAGMNINKFFDIIQYIRQFNKNTPIVILCYINSILHYGIDEFLSKSKELMIDGILPVDLPYEEAGEFANKCQDKEIDLIRLITPTSSISRIKKNSNQASGFLYYVSIKGITGTKSSDMKENERFLNLIKEYTDLPVAIGFGINNKNDIDNIKKIGFDGYIIGSKIIKEITFNYKKLSKKELLAHIANFITDLK